MEREEEILYRRSLGGRVEIRRVVVQPTIIVPDSDDETVGSEEVIQSSPRRDDSPAEQFHVGGYPGFSFDHLDFPSVAWCKEVKEDRVCTTCAMPIGTEIFQQLGDTFHHSSCIRRSKKRRFPGHSCAVCFNDVTEIYTCEHCFAYCCSDCFIKYLLQQGAKVSVLRCFICHAGITSTHT